MTHSEAEGNWPSYINSEKSLSSKQAHQALRKLSLENESLPFYRSLDLAARSSIQYERNLKDNTSADDTAPFIYGALIGYDIGSRIVGPDTIEAYQLYLQSLPLNRRAAQAKELETFDDEFIPEPIMSIGEYVVGLGIQSQQDNELGIKEAAPVAQALRYDALNTQRFITGVGYSMYAAHRVREISQNVSRLSSDKYIVGLTDDSNMTNRKARLSGAFADIIHSNWNMPR